MIGPSQEASFRVDRQTRVQPTECCRGEESRGVCVMWSEKNEKAAVNPAWLKGLKGNI